MAKKPKRNQPETPNDIQERDLFETPRYATELLLPFIPGHVRRIWEPCAGSGRMYNVLRDHLSNRWGKTGWDICKSDIQMGQNFNVFSYRPPIKWQCMTTNPAYSLKKNIWDLFVELDNPFALLIPADYSGWIIRAIRDQGAEKIIPERRIDYLTPNIVERINKGEKCTYTCIDEIAPYLLAKYSTSQFHSMWICYKFNIGKTETFVPLSIKDKLNIL